LFKITFSLLISLFLIISSAQAFDKCSGYGCYPNLSVRNDNYVIPVLLSTPTIRFTTSIILDVLANDSDPDGDPISILSTTFPSNGTVTINPFNDFVTYIPNESFVGIDTFEYTIRDHPPTGDFLTDSAIVTITITTINTSPNAVDDAIIITTKTVVNIPVLDNDLDPDGDSLTISNVTQGAKGTVTTDGNTITYTPSKKLNKSDFFNYTITDGKGGTSTATVTITLQKSGGGGKGRGKPPK